MLFIERLQYLREKSIQGFLSIAADGSILVGGKKSEAEYVTIKKNKFKRELIYFSLSFKGPWNEIHLARLWYENRIPKTTKKFNGFWTEKQMITTLRLLRKLGVDLSPRSIQKTHHDFYRASQYVFSNYGNLLKTCNIKLENTTAPITAIDYYNFLNQARENGWFGKKDGQIWVQQTTGGIIWGHLNSIDNVYIPYLRLEGARHHVETLNYICDFPGPYDEKILAKHWYEHNLPLIKKHNGFWTEKQAEAIMEILIERNINLEPGFIHKNYPDVYNAFGKLFGSYWEALENFKIDTKKLYEVLKVDHMLFGVYVEHCVWEIIRKNSSCFEFQTYKGSGRLDLWNKKKKKVIDIKTSVYVKIDKEIKKYIPDFGRGNVIAAFLYGPEDYDKVIKGVRKISIFQWINENSEDFDNVQLVLKQLRKFRDENDYKSGDPLKTAAHFFNLTKRVFELALKEKSSKQIADMVYLSRRQVERILEKKTLVPYIDEKLYYRYQKKKNRKMENLEKRDLRILELFNKGYELQDIANDVGMSRSGIQSRVKVLNTEKEPIPQKDRSVRVYTAEGKYIGTYPSGAYCSRSFGVSKSTISRLLRGIPTMHDFKYLFLYNETFTKERLQQKLQNVKFHR